MAYLDEFEIGKYASIINGVTMGDAEIASDLIDSYLGRSLQPRRYVERVRLIKGRRGKLQHSPVISIDFVNSLDPAPFNINRDNFDGHIRLDHTLTQLDLRDIVLDPENDGYFTFVGSGDLISLIYGVRPHMLEIGYVGGFDHYPNALKTACGMLACNVRQALSFAGAKELTSLDFRIAMSDDSFFTSDIKRLLDSIK